MENLYNILKQIYPERDFMIRLDIEQQESEKVINYLLYIEGRETEEFNTYGDLEKFILRLTTKRSVDDATDIGKGINPYEK